MALTIEPLYDRIVVRRKTGTGMSEGKFGAKLYLPDGSEQKAMMAEVVACGEGYRNDDGSTTPLQVREGDHVLLGKFAGTEFEIDGQVLTVMREDEALLILRDSGDLEDEPEVKEVGDKL